MLKAAASPAILSDFCNLAELLEAVPTSLSTIRRAIRVGELRPGVHFIRRGRMNYYHRKLIELWLIHGSDSPVYREKVDAWLKSIA